ncbi:MAG TPA: M48 family metalloprotease [Pyrinomonadaceae bacterium]|jgi:Zn-dependent protease with chaperone function
MRSHRRAAAPLLLALAALLACAAPARPQQAQPFTRDVQHEARYWAELNERAPDAVESFKAATEALDRGDAAEAARLYREVQKRAPDWEVSNRRLGYALVALGQKDEGFALLRKVVARHNSPENLAGLAQTLAYPGPDAEGTPDEKREARALAEEAFRRNKDTSDPFYALLLAQLALEQDAEDDLRRATASLSRYHPDLMATHFFRAVLAAADGHWFEAEREIKRAGELGLPAETVNKFLASGVHTRVLAWRAVFATGGVIALWAGGIGLIFLLGRRLSRRTLRYLETADPNAPPDAEQHRLRRFYRAVINAAGLYYYASLPVVIVLTLGVVAALAVAALMIGFIPVKLLVILGAGACVTVYQMIRSLFVRHKQEDPGRVLRPEEAPGLWALAREVAATVGTRPVSEIRVTPGTEVAVYERGSLRARMRDEAERVLLVGVGVLNGFRQDAFRAVLAHEYGHFQHRDTAGGDIALRVKTDMLNFARGMAASGQNTKLNVGFQFLRLYFKLFTAISHGAGRLQEVLADRLAARHYGVAAFREGLKHVVRQQISFEHAVRQEVQAAAGARRALVNIYELPEPTAADAQRTLTEECERALNRETEETDTHPSPAERLRLLAGVNSPALPDAPAPVWDLFADRTALTNEMSALVASHLTA